MTTGSSYQAADIEVLEGLEGVRKRPGMYIGGTDQRAYHHLVTEVLDNAMDEVLAGHADRVRLTLDREGTVVVWDNGRGIPVDPHPRYPDRSALEVVLTMLHAGGKFHGRSYATSAGLHGVGLSVVAALTVWLEVEVARDGFRWRQCFARGKPIAPLERLEPTRRRGTKVSFRPDPDIFGQQEFQPPWLVEMGRSRAYLHRGMVIDVSIESEGLEHRFCFPGGLRDYVLDTARRDGEGEGSVFEGAVTSFGDGPGRSGGRLEWAVIWTGAEGTRLLSYCNTVPTPGGGTHEAGLRLAMVRSFREFADDRNLLPKGVTLGSEEILDGMLGVLSLFIPDPEFSGQTKDRLNTIWLTRQVESVIKDHLDHWLHGNPEASARLVEGMVIKARDRMRRRELPRVNRKSATARLTLPGKLTDCVVSDPRAGELFIVEGDSAGGTAKQARDRHTQAVLPLRGKILNVEQANAERFEKNSEIQNLIIAIGAGWGSRYDGSALRYGRIIIMTDADVDGAHIASLLLTFFFRSMPKLIDDGHLYLAQPPLYRVTVNNESVYALDDAEKEVVVKRLVKKHPRSAVNVSRFKGLGEMAAVQLRETTMHPKTRRLVRVENDDEALTRESFDRLMGKRPAERFRFIQERAIFSRDRLDI